MDWLGYSPADLVPFSRGTWLGLMARYNAGHWPAVAAGIGAGVLLLWLTAGGAAWRLRGAQALLAAGWLWVAWAFFHQSLRQLLWAAHWLALGFAVQGLLLLLSALLPLPAVEHRRWPMMSAWALLVPAVLVLPAAQALLGQPVSSLSWFGSAPTPTALATLALLALIPAARAWLLVPLPLAWCLIATGMLGVFADPLWLLPGLAAVALVAVRLLPTPAASGG